MRSLLLGMVGVVVLWPLDGWLFGVMSGLRGRLGGDLRRELEAAQQFGQGGSIVLVTLVILSLDPRGARRLLNWGVGLLLAAGAVFPLKMLAGRPRPGLGRGEGTPEFGVFYSADTFLGPLGVHPFDAPVGPRHAWEFWGGISSDLWSMPSAHTAYAVVMAVFVGACYPRVAWLVWVMAGLVGVARVVFGAHYPTDVVAGAAIGAAAGLAAVRGRLGERVLERMVGKRGTDGENRGGGV